MADASTKRIPQDQPDDSSANGTGSLEELRHLILAPEQEALERLHHRVANPEARTEDEAFAEISARAQGGRQLGPRRSHPTSPRAGRQRRAE